MAERETEHTSDPGECIPCEDLLARIDADLLEYAKATAASRSKRLKTVAMLLLVAVGGVVAWWWFA